MKKGIVCLLAAVTAASGLMVFLAWGQRTVYIGDASMADKAFWSGRSAFSASLAEKVIPEQIPGPLDVWAGGDEKEIGFESPYAGAVKITIRLYDSHNIAPPVLRVMAGGRKAAEIQTPPGNGQSSRHWRHRGRPAELVTPIPAGFLEKPGERITIRSASGSWAAIRDIRIQKKPRPFFILAGAAGLAVLLVLMAWRLTVERRWGEAAVNAALALASVVLTLAGVEIVLRGFFPQKLFEPHHKYYFIPDDDVGYVLKPNVRTYLGNDTNRFGMRDYDRYSLEKPDGVFRILCIGDSLTFSWTTLENSYPKILEELFNGAPRRVEALNAGVPSYATSNEYYYLRKYGLKFQPDLVILGFYVGNDIQGNDTFPNFTAVGGGIVTPAAAKERTEEEITRERSKRVFLNSFHLYRLVSNRNYAPFFEALSDWNARWRREGSGNLSLRSAKGGCLREHQLDMFQPPSGFDPVFRRYWDNTLDYLDRITKLAADNGVKLVTVIIPSEIQMNTGESLAYIESAKKNYGFAVQPDYPQKALMEEAEKRGWLMFDPIGMFREKSKDKLLYLCGDDHFNAEGNRLLAEILKDWLAQKGLLPPGVK